MTSNPSTPVIQTDADAASDTAAAPVPIHIARAGTNLNPEGIGLWALIREDRLTHYGGWFEQGFWALATHRFGNWRKGIRSKLLRLPFTLLYKMMNKKVEWFCGISLPDYVRVGRKVRLWHFGGMMLHADTIGDGAQVRHNTTFGVTGSDHNFELPVIGPGADIGVGAVILGGVTIGQGAVIGANAVVTKDIPAHCVAVGLPAKVIKQLDGGGAS